MHLGAVDSFAGGLVGAFKAGIVLSLVFVTIAYFRLPDDVTVDESRLYEPVYEIVPEAWSFLVDRSSALEDIKSRVDRRSAKRAAT